MCGYIYVYIHPRHGYICVVRHAHYLPTPAHTHPTKNTKKDVPLIEGLEATKAAATEITAAVAEGRRMEEMINQAREFYRPQVWRRVGWRGGGVWVCV